MSHEKAREALGHSSCRGGGEAGASPHLAALQVHPGCRRLTAKWRGIVLTTLAAGKPGVTEHPGRAQGEGFLGRRSVKGR